MKTNRLLIWIKDFLYWLTEAKIGIICIFVIVVAVAVSLVIWPSEFFIRLTGYVLQLFGMILTIRGLLKIRTHFGQPPLRQLLINWLKRFPKWKKRNIIALEPGRFTLKGSKIEIEQWTPDNPDQPMEKRIEGINRNLERIRKEQIQHAKYIEVLGDSLDEHKQKVVEENKTMEEKIQSGLESLHTSDILTSFVGLIWLTIGISMSTMASELSELFQ